MYGGYAWYTEERKKVDLLPGRLCFEPGIQQQPCVLLRLTQGTDFTMNFKLLASWENLVAAFRSAAKGKRSRTPVAWFEQNLEVNILELQSQLLAGSYQPGAYEHFFIHEPKRRLISAAPFRDRIVHHALCRLIEPIFERSFIHDSYANRVGKGTHRAIDRAQHFSRNYKYAIHIDVKKFFPSIDHAILKEMLSSKIKETKIQNLIALIIDSGKDVHDKERRVIFPEDDLFTILRPTGLPIGNLTSQFWANVYLNPFDHFVKRTLRCKGYLRYVDDLLLFGNSTSELLEWHVQIQKRLEQFRLKIHPGCHPFPVLEGIPFLGFIIFPHKRLLRSRKVVYFRRKLKYKVREVQSGKASVESLGNALSGWINHVRYGNTVGLQKAVFSSLPRYASLTESRNANS